MSTETVALTAAMFLLLQCQFHIDAVRIICDTPRSSLIVLGISKSNRLAEMLSFCFLVVCMKACLFCALLIWINVV